MKLSIEEILANRSVGRMQSVGQMQVIPILGEDDDLFAAPEVEAGTTGYGKVQVRNRQDRATILPPGSAWVVNKSVQDHAIGSGALVKARSERVIDKAMCIQQTQPGLIEMGRHELQILPARLRARALELRGQSEYNKLWDHIGRFKSLYGMGGGSNLADFLRNFARELDEFVAEFELVPEQIGAIILVGGKVVGIEVTPSRAYWEKVWTPLVRVCYGSIALHASRAQDAEPPRTRSTLEVLDGTLDGIEAALDAADKAEEAVVRAVVISLAMRTLEAVGKRDDSLAGAKMYTVSGRGLIGQLVTVGRGEHRIKYASLVAQA